jgi:hypothetical protein
MAADGDGVHLLWSWYDGSEGKPAAGSGLFHVQRLATGFGQKVRVVEGEVNEWDAARDPGSGRLLLVFGREDGVYVMSKPSGGAWSRAARLHPTLDKGKDVCAEAVGDGSFVVRTGAFEVTQEWVVTPK